MEKLISCEFFVEGMHCAACELLIERKLSKIKGVKKVDAKLNENKVYLESDHELFPTELSKLVEEDGYRILAEKQNSKTINKKSLVLGFLMALTFFVGFLLLQKFGIINLASGSDQITLPFVFHLG